MSSLRSSRLLSGFALLTAGLLLCSPIAAQSSSSSSSSSSAMNAGSQTPAAQSDQSALNPENRPRIARVQQGDASVTMETSEPLFDMAAALNACGYDADMDISLPVRKEVRDDMNAALAASESARDSRDKLCQYIRLHKLNDLGLSVGQYVSLALYLSPPPDLTPNVGEDELPPQADAVVNVLPLLRDYVREINLHYIWLKHRAEYEALVARVHDPMEQMILNTNIYLHQPVSSYDGRRFLILLEPLLSPNLTNARIYGSDYIIVTSPDNKKTGVPVQLDQIRHIYLHYVVEPMVYSRGAAMERIQPLLRGVADAPLDFRYKSDVVALITECLIKAIEAKMYKIPGPAPELSHGPHARSQDDLFMQAKAAYDRETQLEQQKLVDLDESHGWVLTGYFYQALTVMGNHGDGLRDEIAPMIYGMDVDRELQHAKQVIFKPGTNDVDPLRPQPQPRKLDRMDVAEQDLQKGQVDQAAEIAAREMADPAGNHGRAQYLLARVDLLHGDPQKAMDGFEATLKASDDPRTVAWSHIYLGRLYDTMDPPDRDKAVAEYKEALAHRDANPDTKEAAEAGIAKPFALPGQPQPDDQAFDPTGKAQKEAWKPGASN